MCTLEENRFGNKFAIHTVYKKPINYFDDHELLNPPNQDVPNTLVESTSKRHQSEEGSNKDYSNDYNDDDDDEDDDEDDDDSDGDDLDSEEAEEEEEEEEENIVNSADNEHHHHKTCKYTQMQTRLLVLTFFLLF